MTPVYSGPRIEETRKPQLTFFYDSKNNEISLGYGKHAESFRLTWSAKTHGSFKIMILWDAIITECPPTWRELGKLVNEILYEKEDKQQI
ncbi:hypothetical protein GOV04_00880 [Candidatus Woesearchaeota archaeon]|nr:hypothetical protein [Candidatus Woesearchaeota archaeon]